MLIALYLILGFLCISSENGGVWRLCEGLKEYIEDLSLTSQRLNVVMLRLDNSVAQRRDVATSSGLGQREFQIKRKRKKMEETERGG